MARGNFPKVYLYRRIVYAKLFIDEHYAEKIDLVNIANEAFFSKFHFIRLFYTLYNKTPHQYLSCTRIEKAKQLLQSDISVSQTCYAVGFESVSSFTGLFKRITGQTPAAYQKEQRQKLADMADAPLKFIPNCFAEMNGWVGGWSLVIGHWSLVIGHWSLVIGHWSLVIGHWSLNVIFLLVVDKYLKYINLHATMTNDQ